MNNAGIDSAAKQCNTEGSSQPQDAAGVAQLLKAFSLIPLHALAEGRNQSIRSLVHELTGLSKARIAKGNLDAVRPSTQKQIEDHQKRWLAEQLDNPEALAHAQRKVATSPCTQSGKHASFAGWVHQFEFPPDIELPISKAVSLVLDELVERLLTACVNNDLVGFKQTLKHHIEHHGLAVRTGESPVVEPAPQARLTELQSLQDWAQIGGFMRKFVDDMYWDVISVLDAEWSSCYFSGRQSMPLFPLVMVRLQDGLLEHGKVSSRKNICFRPARRLLEFMYAIVFYHRYKKWPEKPPPPKVLAGILYRPDSDELLDQSVVSSYFDGSTKLTLDLVWEHWFQLFHHFMPEKKEGQRVPPPFPMIMLALKWQTWFVQDNGKSFYLLDLERYGILWTHRRRQWESNQVERQYSSHPAGHTTGEPIAWPAWMTSQSSSFS